MRALVTTGRSDTGLEIAEVDAPAPTSDQALVAVHAFSLNRGEVRRVADSPPGARLGWDVAGVVEQAAADGSGPAAGTRVVGMVLSGGWAEKVAVPTDTLAPLPAGISDVQAAALPVAGLTALRALHRGGLLLGARVLVTGAAGGVGRFAVQLAALSGAAEIHATVRNAERGTGLPELGATRVLVDGDPLDGPYDLAVEGVGGASLAAAATALAPGGIAVSFASSGPEGAPLPPRWFGTAPRASVTGLFVFDEVAQTRSGTADLALLARLVAAGRLDPNVSLEGSWREPEPLLRALLDRQVAGKAVLTVD